MIFVGFLQGVRKKDTDTKGKRQETEQEGEKRKKGKGIAGSETRNPHQKASPLRLEWRLLFLIFNSQERESKAPAYSRPLELAQMPESTGVL